MTKTQEFYQAIVDSFENGNISSTKEDIKKLTKLQLIQLIKVWGDYKNLGIAIDEIEILVKA